MPGMTSDRPNARATLTISRAVSLAFVLTACVEAAPAVLNPGALLRHVARFNAMEDEPVVNLVPNAEAAAWLKANIPLFECPDAEIEEMYFYRWWAERKH